MTTDKYLAYRGDIQSVLGVGSDIVFVTLHPDRQPTGLYRLDTDKLILTCAKLPEGARCFCVDEGNFWIGGSDGHVYFCPAAGSPSPRGSQVSDPIVDLALLKDDRLAVLAGMGVTLLQRANGKTAQVLELPEVGTCLAVAPTGDWLVVGTNKGTVLVFEAETKQEFSLSASDRLHEGPVTALLFRTDDLRFLSAGADLKLLSTYARGNLEPEDRGRGNNHTEVITGLAGWAFDRFFTGSRDSTLKSWPPTQGGRPVTLKDGVAKVVDVALITIHTKPHLVIACEDNTLRIFALDEEGKFGEFTHRIYDAVEAAKNELAAPEATQREKALKTLAGYGDGASLDIIAERMMSDPDHTVRLLAAKLLAASKHPRATVLLEKGFTEASEAVRTTCFKGLQHHRGESDLHPIDLALKTEKPDLGKLAVQALEPLAAKDDQALTRLANALNAKTFEVRQAALMSLEKAFETDSPEADLGALGSQHADVRRLALIRLYYRKLLKPAKVQSALRWRCEDADAEVRRTAFLMTLATHDLLLVVLRSLDPELHRQFSDLEATAPDGTPRKDVEPKPQPESGSLAPRLRSNDGELEPLLQATASRSLDTCLRGARGLAVLHDPRAFGLLLQLSREQTTQARVEVCWAMAALGDPRVLSRLKSLLQDNEASVRDAAYSALLRAHAADALTAADIGLSAPHEDVRRRALQVLLETVRKMNPLSDIGSNLLSRALNDASAHVRREAFKAALNLKNLGSAAEVLQFTLKSIHADVRREALTEVMAQVTEAWAWPLLLSFLHDPDKTLRDETLTFACKKFKEKELEILEEALKSRFTDMRLQAVEGLIKKATKAAQALLVRALDDAESAVRLRALEALINADARKSLTDALQSTHEDVRIRAAVTLARHGLAVAKAPLLAQVQTPQPKEKERENDWANLVAIALEGLGYLGDSITQPAVVPLLNHARAEIRKAAIQALVGMAQPDGATLEQAQQRLAGIISQKAALPGSGSPGVLQQALQHADPQVKYRAALGLAYAGDSQAAPIVFSADAKRLLTPYEILAAACTCKPAEDEQLALMLDDDSETVRNAALFVMMLREMVDSGGSPTRAVTCLSSRMPRVRLTAARALECFPEPEQFDKFVVELFNDRDEEKPWKVTAEVVRSVAELLSFGSGQTIARTVMLFEHLQPKEQSAWDLAYGMHAERFADAGKAIHQRVSQAPKPKPQYDAGQLKQLAFGAYVGLVREQGTSAQQANLPAIIRVRQTALARVVTMATTDAVYNHPARSVGLQALGDPNQPVRMQALEALQTLGLDSTTLGAEAIETGHLDLGIKGLELLTDGTSKAEGETVLEQVMLTRRDHLSREAAKLLMARRPKISVMQQALNAADEDLRREAIAWIAAEYEQSSEAQHALRQALESRYQKVRLIAALTLGTKKDPRAFDALVKSLHSPENINQQREIINALVTLGDKRTPPSLLDRLENDPAGTAPVDVLLSAIGTFRQPESVDRLLAYADRTDSFPKIAPIILTISGHDQRIVDPQDENPDKRWEKEQYPRRDAVLARLMEQALQRGVARLLVAWLPAARWARGNEIDPVLALLAHHSDVNLRNQAIEAIGWRIKKRKGPYEPLVKALRHRDPTTQFLAAEKLALAQRPEGINVLLSSIEYLEDVGLRRRAVLALGELSDNRAIETLQKLASEDGHALQNVALEAIGHFPHAPESEAIFKLLERHARRNDERAKAALQGLRWFNDRAAWQVIRQRAAERGFSYRLVAIELLRHNDEPGTRELLLQLLMKPGDINLLKQALLSARALWSMESLEPDYAVLRSGLAKGIEDSVKRVCDKGQADRIFAIFPECAVNIQAELATSLINRPTLPIEQAQTALDHPDAGTVQLAAHILGRVASKNSAAPIERAIKKWLASWNERRQWVQRTNAAKDTDLERITSCLEMLLWAALRVGASAEVLRPLAEASPEDRWYRPVRLAALTALAQASKPSATVLAALESAATGNDAEARTLAVEALARLNPKQTSALSEKILSDRISFRRLAAQKDVPIHSALESAAGQLHQQGVVLPLLIARHDNDTLATVAANAKLPEATRLGAIEGLAALADEKAEAKLIELGKNESETEALRKAAWRGVRRSWRARKART